MELQHMNVLLTGATGGIGRVIARQLVEAGASVLLTSHMQDDLVKLGNELIAIAQSPEQVRICTANLLEAEGLDNLCAEAVKSNFPINALINNAGMMQFSLFDDQNPQLIPRTIELNTIAPMLLTQALLPHLKAQPQAQIINIGSTFGSIGYPGFVTYCTSKAAMQGFSQALKRELRDTFIEVKYLSPRATKTELNSPAVVALNKKLGNTMDSPDLVAKATLELLTHTQSNKVLGWPEKFFVQLNKLFPALVDMAIGHQLPTIKKFATQKSQ